MTLIQVIAQSQHNPLWSQRLLGFSERTIGTHGCAVTSLAMLLNTVTQSTRYNPNDVNSALRQRSAFCGPWANYVDWPMVPSIWPCVKNYDRFDYPNSPTPKPALDEIDRRLNYGLPVIIYVDASPEKGLQQHFVLVIGRDDEGEYTIANPWRGTQHSLCPTYSKPTPIAVCGIILFDRGAWKQ